MASARIRLVASPGARASSLERTGDDMLRVRIGAPAVQGKANRELLRFLAERLDVPPSALRLLKGSGARHKTVEVDGLSSDEAERRLRLP